ncbi:transporter [Flavobacterium oreochromis]|uniref:ZIP family metal transporter n=1 Tax=Flavobacterium oreochromis TaxID=2906078 RepID=UPI000B662B53|nr:transporter [Flavobacterium oreochromis]OWP78068.1 hypothetical protein BWG23_03445 [Flavobacterium oreochromis]POR24092.1 hypothetical protein BWK58_08745 [Flavobacterium columnare]
MNEILLKTLLYTCIPLTTFVIGGFIATYFKPNATFRSIILHFAAGVVFSVVAIELLPDIIKRHQPLYVTIGFLIGTVLMLYIKDFTEKDENKHKTTKVIPKIPISFLVAIGVDILIDGFLLGIGFTSGVKAGLLLTIALALEMFSMGMAVASELANESITKKRSLFHIIALSSLFLISATLGGTLLQNLSNNWMEVVLSFGLSALLFLVTEELLVEAHNETDKPMYTATFFIGFLIFLILGMTI